MLNLRMKARGRPHKGQRFFARTLNAGFFPIFSFLALVDKVRLLSSSFRNHFRKGMPSSANTALACSLFFAVVHTVTVIPFTLSTRS